MGDEKQCKVLAEKHLKGLDHVASIGLRRQLCVYILTYIYTYIDKIYTYNFACTWAKFLCVLALLRTWSTTPSLILFFFLSHVFYHERRRIDRICIHTTLATSYSCKFVHPRFKQDTTCIFAIYKYLYTWRNVIAVASCLSSNGITYWNPISRQQPSYLRNRNNNNNKNIQ